MPAAPLPSDENERLEILNRYAILDTLPEQHYDDLTFLASQICGTPISLLSLSDRNRQWFKSRQGITQEELPRDLAFCAYAILDKGVMQVPDAAQDARFADNPLVTGEPKIRFYAGAPLITSEGFALGTLCVAGTDPQQLSPAQVRSLEALARQAVSQMELWRSFRQLEIAGVERSIALRVAEESMSRLEETQERFRQFMDNSPVMAVIKDGQGRYVYANAPLEKTFNISFADLKGKDDYAWLPRVAAEAVRVNDFKVLRSGEVLQDIEIVPTPSGGDREWLVFKFPIETAESGRMLGVVGLDVTEQRRSERLKSEFVSVVSHELRTPLTSIRGALGLLAGGVAGEMSAQARQMIDIAQKNGDRLILLINDILDIEKIESGQMRFEISSFELRPWLLNAVEQNRNYGEALGVQIEVDIPENLGDLCVRSDANRLDQVVANLLSNACKWTPNGGTVRVTVEIAGTQARISVIDQGPGVPPEFVPRLFEKFGQADSSSTRKKGGTGLGLTITRAILEKLDGSIEYIAPTEIASGEAESSENALFRSADSENASAEVVPVEGANPKGAIGATFRFDLPLCASSLAAISPAPSTVNVNAHAAGKILICEDDPEVASLLQIIAAQNGYETEIAATLGEARAHFASGQFAGMTLDLLLPDGNGLDLLRELRAGGNTVPVVVISAVSQQGKLHGEALSVLDWLDKPLDAGRLLTSLARFKNTEGACLLHVEDDADVRSVVAAILGSEVHIVTATTLLEARQHLQNRRFDLAIIDLGLRDGNGLDLVEELNGTDPPTPVILFSTQEPDPQETRSVSASLVKSRTGNDELRDTIRRFLGQKAK